MRKDLPMRVYIITNMVNGKQYVGVTSQTIQARFLEHKKSSRHPNRKRKLLRAMRKYGEENFKVELLEDNIPYEQITEKEQFYIAKYDTYNNGYNMTIGGDGICGYAYGEYWREKMQPVWDSIYTEERAKKISNALKGTHKSEQHRKKLSEAKKEYYKTHKNPFTGKHHTDESKQKQREQMTKHHVLMLDHDTNEVIQQFFNVAQAAQWIKDTQGRSAKVGTIRCLLHRICQGTADCSCAYGYGWKFIDKKV